MQYRTVAFTGTSLSSNSPSWGWINDARDQMQRGSRYEVRTYDLGFPGRVSSQGLSDIGRLVALRPNVAVIEYAMNDAIAGGGISVATLKSNLAAMVDAIVAGSPATTIFLMTMNPAISPGTSVVPNLADYYQGVRDTVTLKGVNLIDNTPLYGTLTSGDMDAGGIHPVRAKVLSVLVPSVSTALSSYVS